MIKRCMIFILCLLQVDCAFCDFSSRNRIRDCAQKFQRNQTRSTWFADNSTGWSRRKEKSSCMLKRINNIERTAKSDKDKRILIYGRYLYMMVIQRK